MPQSGSKRLARRCLGFVLGLTLSSSAFGQWLQNPLAAWTQTLLMNQILVSEYEAVFQETGITPKERSARSLSPYGIALWQRAQFALYAAKLKNQNIGDTTRLRGLLLEQQAFVRKQRKLDSQKMTKFLDSIEKDGFKATAASFQQEDNRKFFENLEAAYTLADGVDCPQAREDRIRYENLVATGQQGDKPALQPVAQLIKSWGDERQRCLVHSLLQRDNKVDPEPFFQVVSLERQGSLNSGLSLMEVAWHLQTRNFPESLRLLFELQKSAPPLRVPYELVQVIYGYQQKGEGSVALRGL